jgi:hypothetical protein
MENLRPHHIICLTRLYSALQLFSKNSDLYYDCMKDELRKNSNLRADMLDNCKFTWGIIYNREVMKVLTKVITDGSFITSKNSCDSICHVCYGKIDDVCVAEDKIQIMDTISTNILNLQNNTLTNITIKDNIDFDKVCSMCGTKVKCDFIRRAVKGYELNL